MQESKVFIGGGLDSDTATEYVANTDYRDALNIRIVSSDGNSDGYITSVTGNNILPYTLPVGVNKGVGGEFFQSVMAAYVFIYNTNGFHRIVEITYDEVVTTLFENLTDSGGEDALFLLAGDDYVRDIKLVDKKYLYFIDCRDTPCVINIDRLKDGSYGVVTNDDFNLIKAQPLIAPTGEYITNTNKSVNAIYNKTFQFRYHYVYIDNEESAKSSISPRYLPDPEEGDIFDISKNNGIKIGFRFPILDQSANRIKQLVLSVRQDNYDWQEWKVVDMDYIFNDIPTVTPFQPPPPNYVDYKETITNTYWTYFYNDGTYAFEDPLENDLAFDWIPRFVGAQEIVNGNVLTLGDLTEGYDKPIVPDGGVTLTKSKYTVEVQASDVFQVITYTSSDPATNPESAAALFKGVPDEGDILTVSFYRNADEVKFTYSYTVTAGQSLQQALQSFADYLNTQTPPTASYSGNINAVIYNAGVDTWGLSFNSFTYSDIPVGEEGLMMRLEFVSVQSSAAADIGGVQRVLKKNSSYQLALSYADKFGRLFPLVTGQNFVVETDPDNVNLRIEEFQQIDWSINLTPPVGAVRYQWLLSHNNTHKNWVSAPAYLDKANSGGNVWVWDITSLLDFATDNNGTIVSYGYTQGDLARIVYRKFSPEAQGNTYFNLFNNKVMQIRSFELEQDTNGDTIKYVLKTTPPTGISLSTIPDGVNVLLELYTPADNTQSKIFYEIGESYSIDSGVHSVTSGSIKEGDSFVKLRRYEWVGLPDPSPYIVWMLESQHISDYKVSNFHNYGRPRTEGDVVENKRSPASIRFSDIYRRRSNINMLNRFYAERIFEELNEDYGAIRAMRVRDNIMVVIQEFKVAYVPVLRNILEDLEEQQNVSISSRLLNTPSYSKGDDIGVGSRVMSISSKKSQFYWVDPHRKLPVRAGLDGVKHIGGKFSTEMSNLIDDSKETIGYYDNLNDEYIVRIGDVTYVYSEIHDKWICRYSYLPEIGITAVDKMFTIKLGALYVHRKNSPKNTFYGVTTKPTINIVINSNPAISKTWKNISIQSSELVVTTIDGVQTSLGQISDLLAEDFQLYSIGATEVYDREGNYYANFLRDKNIDLISGDRLKGNWVTINLTPDGTDWKIFRIGVNYDVSLITP